ncbi:hypothetical protein [Nocardia pseudobrasiliensis]|uniref:hypothetical protein n=1 Tax=Nocardia pseudobrasiliensis TaxID=45979 RepID=UPI000831B2A5|nr:hypothetical protein [Nocardia pseudobrasiliensis]
MHDLAGVVLGLSGCPGLGVVAGGVLFGIGGGADRFRDVGLGGERGLSGVGDGLAGLLEQFTEFGGVVGVGGEGTDRRVGGGAGPVTVDGGAHRAQ